MRKAYGPAAKMEAITLSSVVGADQAGSQLGIDPRTIRIWSAAAGRRPELDGEPDRWRELRDLAIAKVTADVAAGKVRVRDLAVVAAIATRNASPRRRHPRNRPKRQPKPRNEPSSKPA